MIFLDLDHFVFALIDCAFDPVGFVVVHGVADADTTHQVGDARRVSTEIFFEYQVKVIRKKEESVECDWCFAKVRGVTLADHGLWGQTLDPRERSGVGEAEVVGEEEDKGFVVCLGFE